MRIVLYIGLLGLAYGLGGMTESLVRADRYTLDGPAYTLKPSWSDRYQQDQTELRIKALEDARLKNPC